MSTQPQRTRDDSENPREKKLERGFGESAPLSRYLDAGIPEEERDGWIFFESATEREPERVGGADALSALKRIKDFLANDSARENRTVASETGSSDYRAAYPFYDDSQAPPATEIAKPEAPERERVSATEETKPAASGTREAPSETESAKPTETEREGNLSEEIAEFAEPSAERDVELVEVAESAREPEFEPAPTLVFDAVEFAPEASSALARVAKEAREPAKIAPSDVRRDRPRDSRFAIFQRFVKLVLDERGAEIAPESKPGPEPIRPTRAASPASSESDLGGSVVYAIAPVFPESDLYCSFDSTSALGAER